MRQAVLPSVQPVSTLRPIRFPPEEPLSESALPPVSFSSFAISLASSAMVHLGETPDPATGQKSVDLGMARHSIDALAMLEEKTKGNLEDDESKLITSLLYELRSKYVAVSKAQG